MAGIIQGVGSLVSGIFSGIGAFAAAAGYEDAAGFARKSAAITHTQTQVQLAQKQREIYKTLGGQQADVAASGFLSTAGVLDIVRDSAQQASLSRQLITHQGLIEELGFKAQASAYDAQATAAEMQGYGDIAGGIFGAASSLIGI